jgi:hypothetical protein
VGRAVPGDATRMEPRLSQAAWDCEIQVAYISA